MACEFSYKEEWERYFCHLQLHNPFENDPSARMLGPFPLKLVQNLLPVLFLFTPLKPEIGFVLLRIKGLQNKISEITSKRFPL